MEKTIQARYDDLEFTLTPAYVEAIKTLLREQLYMMRDADEANKEYWLCGVATIGNMCNSNYLAMEFGGKGDIDKMSGDVYVEIDPTDF